MSNQESNNDEIKSIVGIIKRALENMDKRFCSLSRISDGTFLPSEKYQERPVAYEFYHQIRKLMEVGCAGILGSVVVQAEVEKQYQQYFEGKRRPDLIFHMPNSQLNVAIVEFKRELTEGEITHDFKKLHPFRTRRQPRYDHLVEVFIGNNESLNDADRIVDSLQSSGGERITIIKFNTTSWKVSGVRTILFRPQGNTMRRC